jgi:hypothetical protein
MESASGLRGFTRIRFWSAHAFNSVASASKRLEVAFPRCLRKNAAVHFHTSNFRNPTVKEVL